MLLPSVSSPALNPALSVSRYHASFLLVFGRLLFVFPHIYLSSTLSSVCVLRLSTSYARTSSIVSPSSFWKPAPVLLSLGYICSFLILSLCVTPHIHRSVFILFTWIRFSCRFVVANITHIMVAWLVAYSLMGNVLVLVYLCKDCQWFKISDVWNHCVFWSPQFVLLFPKYCNEQIPNVYVIHQMVCRYNI